MHTVEDNILLALKADRRVRGTLFWRENAETETPHQQHPGDRPARTQLRERVAGSLSHGQKQWLEIGMLLAQEPKLLLVDEPVAGMTDAETRQTAELLKEINRDKTVIVVEHDMTFVRELGVKVTCLHEGTVHRRRHDRSGLGERARDRSVSGTLTMLEVNAIDLHYGAAQALRGVSLIAEPGKVTCVLGRNGVGKTSLLRALVGQHPVSKGTIEFDGKDITRLKPYERARRGIAYVPQGREIFPLLTVEENLKTGFAPLPRGERNIPDDVFSLFPVLNSMLRPARRRPLRRPAAAARDRPRAGDAAAAAAARRADRGHPALDHQGHRPRHLLSAQSRPDRGRAGRAVSRLRPGARRPFRGDGPRRVVYSCTQDDHGRGRAEAFACDLSAI